MWLSLFVKYQLSGVTIETEGALDFQGLFDNNMKKKLVHLVVSWHADSFGFLVFQVYLPQS